MAGRSWVYRIDLLDLLDLLLLGFRGGLFGDAAGIYIVYQCGCFVGGSRV